MTAMTRWIVVLLLLGSVAAAQGELGALFDPANPRFGLQTYGGVAFRELPRDKRLVAKGLDPLRWKDPPPAADARLQVRNVRGTLYPGFGYAARAKKKQDAFLEAVRRMPADALATLLARIELPGPGTFAKRYFALTKGSIRTGKSAFHPLHALRHSERQFHDWFCDELGRRIRLEKSRALAIRVVAKELDAPDAARRRRAARVLGWTRDERAGKALDRRLAVEQHPETRAALVTARGRLGGDDLRDRLIAWLAQRDFPTRAAALRVCARRGETDFIKAVRFRSPGRLRTDAAAMLGEGESGDVDFYGIKTYSRRVVFMIDSSGSMAFPMDGHGGKREPRFWRTKRELHRTIKALPREVEFNIYLFSDRAVGWQRKLVPASRENKAAAIAFLDSRKPFGGTNVHSALSNGLRSGADTVYLLSDGEPSVGPLVDTALLLEELAAYNSHGRVVFHTIGLSQDQNAALLVNIAHRTGGPLRRRPLSPVLEALPEEVLPARRERAHRLFVDDSPDVLREPQDAAVPVLDQRVRVERVGRSGAAVVGREGAARLEHLGRLHADHLAPDEPLAVTAVLVHAPAEAGLQHEARARAGHVEVLRPPFVDALGERGPDALARRVDLHLEFDMDLGKGHLFDHVVLSASCLILSSESAASFS